MNVFELMAKISLDTSGYTGALSSASGATSGFGSTVGAVMGGVPVVVAKGAVAAGKAVIQFGADAVRAGSAFDQAMSEVAATMGMTVEDLNDDTSEAYQQFQTLRAFAMEQGATTKYSSEQAAQALNYMALAGYDVEKSMRMMPSVLALAAAGNIELAEASDMVTDASSAFGLTEEETVAMIDQMAKAASVTNTSVAQMGSAFLTVGATARTLRGGTQEAAEVLGILADNGIKGSEAGTALRNIMMKLANPTKNGAAALEDMGVAIFDDEGQMLSLVDIFSSLQTAMDGMSDAERMDILGDLFNRYDLSAANALIGTHAERWEEVGEAVDDAAGSAQNMADVKMDNLAGDLQKFQSAFDNLKILLGEELTPGIRNIVQSGTDFVTFLTEQMQEGGALKKAVDFVGDALSAVGSTISTVIDGIKSAIDWINKLIGKEDEAAQGMPRSDGEYSGRVGKFATGIPYVPRDGFVGELHEGERVLTKQENRDYSRGSSGSDQPISITVQSVLDGKVIGESTYNYIRRKERALG